MHRKSTRMGLAELAVMRWIWILTTLASRTTTATATETMIAVSSPGHGMRLTWLLKRWAEIKAKTSSESDIGNLEYIPFRRLYMPTSPLSSSIHIFHILSTFLIFKISTIVRDICFCRGQIFNNCFVFVFKKIFRITRWSRNCSSLTNARISSGCRWLWLCPPSP